MLFTVEVYIVLSSYAAHINRHPIVIVIISRSQFLTTVLHLKERAIHLNPVPVKQLFPRSPFCFFFSGTLPRKMSFSRFPTSLLITRPKYPRMRFLPKTLSLIDSSILLVIEMLVCHTVQVISASFTRSTSQRHSSSTIHLSMFSRNIGKQRKKLIE